MEKFTIQAPGPNYVFHPSTGVMRKCAVCLRGDCRACDPGRNVYWLDMCKHLLTRTHGVTKVPGIDLGAHAGIYGLALKDYISHMFSFEADPEIYEALEINSKAYPNILPALVEIWDTTKDGKLRLDDLLPIINPKRIGFIKIDIEGAEVHALRGMRKILEGCETTLMDIEFAKIHFDTYSTTTDEYFKILDETGFRQIEVRPEDKKELLLANADYRYVTNLFFIKQPNITLSEESLNGTNE